MLEISMRTLPVDTVCASKGRIVFMAMTISGDVSPLIQLKRMDSILLGNTDTLIHVYD